MRMQVVKRLLGVATALSLSLSAVTVYAACGDIKDKIMAARSSLVTLLKKSDKRGADQQKLVKDSADAVSDTLAKVKAPAGKEATLKELIDTWNAFKKTREDELVPMILAGKQGDAEKLAGGVQGERFEKMMALCEALDRK